ncbi:alpha-ketoacid dehydrogenase subunit beta [Sphaerisporangium album]|uniref:Pyruvate dehydrogenase E1 component subunit beta n=1 Tax=Sphaerisporangium album TaxID=509200 RepID=A0A367FS37_9ACTN|nr:transketolase C-terminal domain-containing protein [Sphaerisporangium album]RCG33243.1 alpha-ketoacid dehydrogenase subunit beta [Sphaerisporangium album]
MSRAERISDNLNRALHQVMEDDPSVHVLGEDIVDPYGGAFKITKGLSTRYGSRVRSTPLSEGGIVGVGAGLALAGDKAIVEIMFGDFAGLAFDQLLNFASKSTMMYGRRVEIPLVVRCPTGGGRGYGPTHSQSLQKHFIGIPGLSVFEMSPFHDARELLPHLLSLGEPCLLFEDKVLYTRRTYRGGEVDDLFVFDLVGPPPYTARVRLDDGSPPDCTLIAPGGVAHRALSAMRALLLEDEITCQLLVPARLYPFDPGPLLPLLGGTRHVCVAEESTAGGTWGGEVAHHLHRHLWDSLPRPVSVVCSAPDVVPTALHLERDVLVQDTAIRQAVLEALA